VVYDPTTGRWVRDPADPQNIPADFNSARVPFYHRIDASVRRNGHLGGASFTPYLSIVNLLNAKNPAGYLYDYTARPPERASFPNLPFAPTFGVSNSRIAPRPIAPRLTELEKAGWSLPVYREMILGDAAKVDF